MPLRQDLAVTGSVNQFADIQPIGGVNEKVEGFYYTCKAVGLTGRQGVVIPARNVEHLVLTGDVIAAVGAGEFHLYLVRTLDECLEVLTGTRAGSVAEPGTVHERAARRLAGQAERQRRFAQAAPAAESQRDE